jgi:hypothetical protein
VQSGQSSTNGKTGEAGLGDGTVNHPLLAEAVEQALCDLVSATPSAQVRRGKKSPIQPDTPQNDPITIANIPVEIHESN